MNVRALARLTTPAQIAFSRQMVRRLLTTHSEFRPTVSCGRGRNIGGSLCGRDARGARRCAAKDSTLANSFLSSKLFVHYATLEILYGEK